MSLPYAASAAAVLYSDIFPLIQTTHVFVWSMHLSQQK